MSTAEDRIIEIIEAIAELKTELREHRRTEEATTNNQYQIMQDIREDVKDYRLHTDKSIHETTVHFDDRISACNKSMIELLEDRHMDKDQVRTEITKAVQASEKRMKGQVRLFALGATVAMGIIGSIITFFVKYGSILLAIIGSSKDG